MSGLERTREALTDSGWNGEGPDECPACGRVLPSHNSGCAIGPEAWAEIELAEAVIQAARDAVFAYDLYDGETMPWAEALAAALRDLDEAAP